MPLFAPLGRLVRRIDGSGKDLKDGAEEGGADSTVVTSTGGPEVGVTGPGRCTTAQGQVDHGGGLSGRFSGGWADLLE